MRLTKSFHRKRYSVTTHNFFTTVKVAGLLQENGTTLVRTVCANVKGIPNEITKGGNDKFSSKFFFNDDKKCMLVNYQCKQKKKMIILCQQCMIFQLQKLQKRRNHLLFVFTTIAKLAWVYLTKWLGSTQHMQQLEDGQWQCR